METDDSLEYSSGLDLTNNSVFLSHLKQDDDDIVVIEENFQSDFDNLRNSIGKSIMESQNSMSQLKMASPIYINQRISVSRSDTTLMAAGYPDWQYETKQVSCLDATIANYPTTFAQEDVVFFQNPDSYFARIKETFGASFKLIQLPQMHPIQDTIIVFLERETFYESQFKGSDLESKLLSELQFFEKVIQPEQSKRHAEHQSTREELSIERETKRLLKAIKALELRETIQEKNFAKQNQTLDGQKNYRDAASIIESQVSIKKAEQVKLPKSCLKKQQNSKSRSRQKSKTSSRKSSPNPSQVTPQVVTVQRVIVPELMLDQKSDMKPKISYRNLIEQQNQLLINCSLYLPKLTPNTDRSQLDLSFKEDRVAEPTLQELLEMDSSRSLNLSRTQFNPFLTGSDKKSLDLSGRKY